MAERLFRWTKKRLREQMAVVRGELAPTVVLKNATYLSFARRRWLQGNIWIYDDRIVYVGEKMPECLEETTEIVDCSHRWIVPGYIEHHGHPVQLYNPLEFAKYSSYMGTTTTINDNLVFFLLMEKKKAFSLLEDLEEQLPTSMYWWCRYDSQTELDDEDKYFSNINVMDWLSHHLVVQGGELTSWPKVLAGDDGVLHWMQETARLRKRIEGHLPGASERTLTQMALLGLTCDHEALTGKDALLRIDLGYMASLRYSSIRPDLPNIIEQLLELGVNHFDHFLLTTDGSTPGFYLKNGLNKAIKIAIDKGVPEIDAYAMASYNVARYYSLDYVLGAIAPGRIAHLNILPAKEEPTPISVLAKGKWVLRDKKRQPFPEFDFGKYGMKPLTIDWNITKDDLYYSVPVGLEMVNEVIVKPYQITSEDNFDHLPSDHDESYFVMLDKHGKWRMNTLIKGFADKVSGFASTFSMTGDIVLIGKNKNDMIQAFNVIKEMGGGIALVENGELLAAMPLKHFGIFSDKSFEETAKEEEKISRLLKERGYPYKDPFYSLLFFSATHLPYIRVTEQGIYDVFKKTILFPSIMR